MRSIGKTWNESWLPKSWIVALWNRFQICYGSRFSSIFDSDPTLLEEWYAGWADELSTVSREQISFGVKNVSDAFPHWPPAVGEFRDLCFSYKPPFQPKITERFVRKPIPENIHKHLDFLMKKMKNEQQPDYRKWAMQPKSQIAVDLAIEANLMPELDYARKNGFVSGNRLTSKPESEFVDVKIAASGGM